MGIMVVIIVVVTVVSTLISTVLVMVTEAMRAGIGIIRVLLRRRIILVIVMERVTAFMGLTSRSGQTVRSSINRSTTK
jgi:hypothetical protein